MYYVAFLYVTHVENINELLREIDKVENMWCIIL